ncbi:MULTISPECIES: FMN-binding negative transcriptional regulator [unclassified Microbulbifer]|uniref:FMN-binding negative transcriptional regulator n=1 Tax=unclassified Microbulbifer TaxID=2619833 RepID=UPI001E37ABFE|nr:FMN-binding negative transcriptional regulator [Microbulbifer sp. YPW16]UHQ53696.1 FMN-binding negative transcriptional regulator [Microbulbifer sp. YPW16]
MYTPKPFRQANPEKIKQIIAEYPLATLVTGNGAGVEAFHLPLVIAERDRNLVLQGHIARASHLWREACDGAEVLLIFNGPNCYISPSLYPTKQEHGRAVPTWNYVSVHIRGNMHFVHDPAWTHETLEKLTAQQEGSGEEAWSISDAPEDYIQKMLKAVVGLEIEVISIEGQWKLSQNQPARNRDAVIGALGKSDDTNKTKIGELASSCMTEG